MAASLPPLISAMPAFNARLLGISLLTVIIFSDALTLLLPQVVAYDIGV
jgi:hypothetical protein